MATEAPPATIGEEHPGVPPARVSPTGGVRARLRVRKAKWDDQPTRPAAVLIATVGVPIPMAVIRQARQLGGGGRPVAVFSIARIHGSSFGLPNPGLLPSKREMDEQQALVSEAIKALERSGVEAWGQVAATRRYSKMIVQAARAQGVNHVLVVGPRAARWRTVLEGDTAREVTRRLGGDAVVHRIMV